jgi:CHAT domain-containing protein
MVDSVATESLMTSFYAQLVSGKTVEDSFAFATQEIRSKEIFRHPYYWAGFTVFGNA